jgi:hypothetical protein
VNSSRGAGVVSSIMLEAALIFGFGATAFGFLYEYVLAKHLK